MAIDRTKIRRKFIDRVAELRILDADYSGPEPGFSYRLLRMAELVGLTSYNSRCRMDFANNLEDLAAECLAMYEQTMLTSKDPELQAEVVPDGH